MKNKILKSLAKASGIKDPHLEFSSRPDFGDYTTNAALKTKNPLANAKVILLKLQKDKDLQRIIDKVEIAGPGFINFWLSTKVLTTNLSHIHDQKDNYGKSDAGKGKTLVIDYSAPNIAKPFGIGHLRSTIIGQALYNLYKFIGYKTIGDSHLGDWGTQFGKIIYMIHAKNLNPKNLTIQDLENLYVEFHKLIESDPLLEAEGGNWFKKLEEGDKYARSVWQTCIDISMQEYQKIYDLLDIKIDHVLGESFYEKDMKLMMQDPKIRKHLQKGEKGATIIDLSSTGIKVPLMLLKSNGTTTYGTRDLATIKYRVQEWNPDIIIYEVSVEQKLYFEQLFAAARILGLVKKDVILYHTNHGWYLGPDGKKFSTRRGKTVKLQEILDEAISKAGEFNKDKKIAKEVGIGAIKYYDLMRSVQRDVVFDWEKVFVLEGNSGPYLQYTYARTQGVLHKSTSPTYDIEVANLEPEELAVLRDLTKFPEIILMAAKNYSPNILCEYLYSLAQKYNTFYNKLKIIASENEHFRLALTSGVGQVLKNGLTLLGIATPEKM